jgi:hypothetical protein
MDAADDRARLRFGNYKPSPPTVEALLEVMKAQHVPIKEYKKPTAGGESK